MGIDLGVPVVSMSEIYASILKQTGTNEEFSHSFFFKAKEIIQNND